MKIELRHIRYFEAVVQEMNFSKASERLNMAQPALSRAIQQLEDRLGAKLLTRTSRNVSLTPAGKVFLEGSTAITQQVDTLEKRVLQAVAGEVGNLTIGYTDFAIGGVLPEIIKKFQSAFPDIHLELVHGFSLQQITRLKNKELDFGFLTIPINEPELDYIPSQEDSFVGVLPENHPLVSQDSIRLSLLENEPFIIGTEDSWSRYNVQMNQLCLSAGFLPKVKQEAFNSEGIFGLISANMGLTIYPSCVANYWRHGVKIRPISEESSKLVTAVAWNKEYISAAQKCFLNFIRERYDLLNSSVSRTDRD
ncbi:MAG: LysR family transcriptional regulator [Pseudomonadales bacterium]